MVDSTLPYTSLSDIQPAICFGSVGYKGLSSGVQLLRVVKLSREGLASGFPYDDLSRSLGYHHEV